MTEGRVVLVGGGPGDPDLITVGGLRALQAADVVLYDHLAPLTCLRECGADALLIDVGKIPGGRSTSQERINELLIEHAQAGRSVVRFKGGDPFVFGRGGEEALACAAAGVPVTVIPGVSSAIAGPAVAGIPITHRSLVQGFTVVSGHVGPDHPDCTTDWSAVAQSGHTIVVLMGVATLAAITAALITAGLDESTPAAVVTDATLPSMRVVNGTLDQIAALADQAGIQPPAITVIGEVASLELGLTQAR